MTERNTTSQDRLSSKMKKVSIRDRSILVGTMVVVNGSRANRLLLKQRFAEGGYQVQETAHFLLFTRVEAPSTILVHTFAAEASSTLIEQSLIQELQPLSLPENVPTVLKGILASFKVQERRAY